MNVEPDGAAALPARVTHGAIGHPTSRAKNEGQKEICILPLNFFAGVET